MKKFTNFCLIVAGICFCLCFGCFFAGLACGGTLKGAASALPSVFFHFDDIHEEIHEADGIHSGTKTSRTEYAERSGDNVETSDTEYAEKSGENVKTSDTEYAGKSAENAGTSNTENAKNMDRKKNSQQEQAARKGEEKFPIVWEEDLSDKITEIEIDMARGDLQIKESDTSAIRVEQDRKDGQSTGVVKDGSCLQIENQYQRGYDGTVILYLPADRKLEEFDLFLGAGDVKISAPLFAGEMDVEMALGSLEAFQPLAAGEASWKVGAGELTVKQLKAEDISVECGTGSVYMDIAGKREEYSLELECGLGSILLDGEEFSGAGIDREFEGTTEKELDISCGMGEVNLGFH